MDESSKGSVTFKNICSVPVEIDDKLTTGVQGVLSCGVEKTRQ